MTLAPLGITDLRFTEEIAWSRERELNPQPTAYKTVALPLCYRGSLASAVFHYFKKIRLSRSMPDGTLAHLRLAEREGFDPPYPLGLRFSRPTHLPILPPLHSAGLSPLVTFAKVGTCRSQRSARLNGLPVWTRTRNSRINSAVHYHCATGK